MKFKKRFAAHPEQLFERDDVRVAANRCPFCHEDVEAKQSVVCQECLARHHGGCWQEAGSCSACRGDRQMSVTALVALRDGRESELADLHERIAGESPRRRVSLGISYSLLATLPLAAFGYVLWKAIDTFPNQWGEAALAVLAMGWLMSFVAVRLVRSARLRLWGYEAPRSEEVDDALATGSP